MPNGNYKQDVLFCDPAEITNSDITSNVCDINNVLSNVPDTLELIEKYSRIDKLQRVTSLVCIHS